MDSNFLVILLQSEEVISFTSSELLVFFLKFDKYVKVKMSWFFMERLWKFTKKLHNIQPSEGPQMFPFVYYTYDNLIHNIKKGLFYCLSCDPSVSMVPNFLLISHFGLESFYVSVLVTRYTGLLVSLNPEKRPQSINTLTPTQ